MNPGEPHATLPPQAEACITRLERGVDDAIAAYNAGTGTLKAVFCAWLDSECARPCLESFHDVSRGRIPTALDEAP